MNETQIHEKMCKNFRKHLGQYQPVSVNRVWAKLGAEEIYRLLVNAGGISKRLAKTLLVQLAQQPWTIKSTAKEGGFDPFSPLHITIEVPVNSKNPAHHLNCKEIPGKGLFIYEITQKNLNT